MRRLFLFAVTALAAIACNKSELDVVNPNNSFVGTPMTITVEMPSSPDTKLDLDQTEDTWITKWTNGDKLTALHYSGTTISSNNTNFTLSEVSEDGKSATFNGSYDNSQAGMVLVYSGTSAGNLLSEQAGLTLANQSIKMSTTNNENIVTPNTAGALSEYSYMISEQIDLSNVPEDYNSVTVKHLTALMELTLQLQNLPPGVTFSVSELQIGISQEDYDEIKDDFKFATLYNEESYDITKGFADDGFTTASEDMGVYNLTVEGLEVSSTSNTFTIPFNAFPFTVMQGEYFDITVVLTQNNVDDNLSFSTPLNFSICNETGSDLEFARGKHHTISYSYECMADDFEYIWDGSTFESIDVAKSVLGEAENGIYYIESASMLAAMSYLVNNDNSNYGSASYTLACPIDLNSKEWTPIGNESNKFSGTFNGNNCTISNLYINTTSSCQGLFGYVSGATIQDLTVSGSVTGSGSTGGIVGQAYAAAATTISNCHNRASVTGATENANTIGGIIGNSYSNNYIINCSNTGAIKAYSYVGGIAGSSQSNSSIVNSYNTGNIAGETFVGGIAGNLDSANVTNCYNTGAVTGTSDIGGVIGLLDGGTVVDCYWLSEVGGASNGIGYDNSTSASSNEGAEPKSDTEMQHQDFATLLRNGAYIYNETEPAPAVKAYSWGTSPPLPYPVLNSYEEPAYNFQGQGLESMPYLITSANDLRQLSVKVNAGEGYSGKYFEMTRDIALTNDFAPIGTDDTKSFNGTFNGGGHTISNLDINSEIDNSYNSLFGYVLNATIKNLSVAGNVKVIAYNVAAAGLVAAANNSTIINCSSSVIINVTINGIDNVFFGCIGGISANIYKVKAINCYNTGSLTVGYGSGSPTICGIYIGGVVGWKDGSVTNCYSAANITFTKVASVGEYVGGVVANNLSGTVTNCYWLSGNANYGIGYDKETKTYSNVGTTEMNDTEMQAANFVTLLNNGAYTYNQTTSTTIACGWKAVLSSYPTLNFGTTPTYSQIDGDNPGIGL